MTALAARAGNGTSAATANLVLLSAAEGHRAIVLIAVVPSAACEARAGADHHALLIVPVAIEREETVAAVLQLATVELAGLITARFPADTDRDLDPSATAAASAAPAFRVASNSAAAATAAAFN